MYELKNALWDVFEAIREISVFKNSEESKSGFIDETLSQLEQSARGLTCMIIEVAETLPLKKEGDRQ